MGKGRQVSHYIPYIPGIIRTSLDGAGLVSGGERGIRTPETLARLPVFKTGAFNHSATSPDAKFSRVVNYSYSAYLQDG